MVSEAPKEWNQAAQRSGPAEIDALAAKNAELEARIFELQFQRTGPVLKCGFLYKYRPWARLFEKPWELRFFSLSKGTISFWKSEVEAMQHPRGCCPLDSCVIIVEGLKRGRFFTFRIDDSRGGSLLRLSTSSEADGRSWVSSLANIGCPVFSEEERTLSDGDRSSGVTIDDKGLHAEDTGTSRAPLPEGLRQRRSGSSSAGGSVGESREQHEGEIQPHPPMEKQLGEQQSQSQSQSQGQSVRHMIRAATPAHRRPKESPLSSDAIFNQSHAGLFNLCVVVLVAVNSRLIIENLMKYGILIRSGFWINSKSISDWPIFLTSVTMLLFPLAALFIEKLQLHTKISEQAVGCLHIVNIATSLIYPAYIIHRVQSSPLASFVLIFMAVILFLKLISYAHTNADVRQLSLKGDVPETAADAPSVIYPSNLTLRNMGYFMAAPTLCYQLGYPRSRHVRKGWVLRQLVKLVIFMGLGLFIIEQYINPTIQNSQHPLKGHFLYSIERVLKLSIPTLYVWLCIFYCFFHLWLNIVAEVLCFGDREFYKDWWNAKTIEEYWRLWNMPVHRWMVRHVYFPCLRRGLAKPAAMLVAFTLSAVFHEVVVGIPCHMVRFWAFLGIIFQVPLVLLTNWLYHKFKKPMVGNMLFWFFFCIVGQPTCVLLYYHDVQVNSALR